MMRSDSTMKVSLTPDRLKSMEVCWPIYDMLNVAQFDYAVRFITKRRAKESPAK